MRNIYAKFNVFFVGDADHSCEKEFQVGTSGST